MRCEDVIILDVKGQSQICDYIVVASGTSERQMKSVAKKLEGLRRDHLPKIGCDI